VSAALSFLPLVLTGFRGLVELGLITGFGILFILLADFTVLPASSVLMAGRSTRKPLFGRSIAERDMIRLGHRRAQAILGIAALLCLLSVWGATRVVFDLNPLRLQTTNAESVVWEKKLIEHSQRSLLSAAVFASSAEEAVSKSKALKALPSVADVENVFSIMPQHQEEKIPLLRSLLEVIPEIRATRLETRPSDLNDLRELLARIRFKMQEEQAATQGADQALVDQMEQVRKLAGEILQLTRNHPDAEIRFNEYRQRFHEDLLNTWDFLRAGRQPSP